MNFPVHYNTPEFRIFQHSDSNCSRFSFRYYPGTQHSKRTPYFRRRVPPVDPDDLCTSFLSCSLLILRFPDLRSWFWGLLVSISFAGVWTNYTGYHNWFCRNKAEIWADIIDLWLVLWLSADELFWSQIRRPDCFEFAVDNLQHPGIDAVLSFKIFVMLKLHIFFCFSSYILGISLISSIPIVSAVAVPLVNKAVI